MTTLIEQKEISNDSLMTNTMDRTIEDIYTYEKQALDLLRERFKGMEDHPNYKELQALLIDQINDELRDYATDDCTDRRANDLREGGNCFGKQEVNRPDY